MVDANRHLRGSGEKLDIITSNQASSEDNEGDFFEKKRARIVSEEDEEDANQTNATVEKIEIKDEEDTCKI